LGKINKENVKNIKRDKNKKTQKRFENVFTSLAWSHWVWGALYTPLSRGRSGT